MAVIEAAPFNAIFNLLPARQENTSADTAQDVGEIVMALNKASNNRTTAELGNAATHLMQDPETSLYKGAVDGVDVVMHDIGSDGIEDLARL